MESNSYIHTQFHSSAIVYLVVVAIIELVLFACEFCGLFLVSRLDGI